MSQINLKISIIIPTLNESKRIGELIDLIHQYGTDKNYEVIIIDANSTDNTQEIALSKNAQFFTSNIKSRAAQMNLGARMATGNIYYFIHADVIPVASFFEDILHATNQGADAGCFAYRFDKKSRMLNINSYFTKFNILGMCGGGDQSLFIHKSVFEKVNGYNEAFTIFEDYDLVKRIKKKYTFQVIKKRMIVSARKYEKNTWLKTQTSHFYIFMLYRLGSDNKTLYKVYNKLLNLK